MPEVPGNPKDIESNKLMAALSYIWALSLVMLLLKKDSPFVQFHARQGFVLFVISVIIMLLPFLWWLQIAVIAFDIMGIWKAYQGETWKAPFISQLADRVKF
jgi:uncharacterized membrane protein